MNFLTAAGISGLGFFEQAPQWLAMLFYASVIASVVAAIAFLLLKLAGRILSAKMICLIWILVILRFVFVFGPPSPTSFLNLFAQSSPVAMPPERFDTRPDFELVAIPAVDPLKSEPALASVAIETKAKAPPFDYARSAWQFIQWTWCAVVVILLLRLMAQAIGSASLVRRSESMTSKRLLNIFHSANVRADGNKRPIAPDRVRMTTELDSPATVGIFRPAILMPRWCETEMTDTQLELVVTHELVHVRRRDVLIQLLIHAVTILHWFNPIARYVRNRIAEYREVTCDQRVLATCQATPDSARRLYAETILQVAEHCKARHPGNKKLQPGWMPGFMGRNRNIIFERIHMLDQKKSSSAKIVGLVCVLTLIAVGFTSAKQPTTQEYRIDAIEKGQTVHLVPGPGSNRGTGNAKANNLRVVQITVGEKPLRSEDSWLRIDNTNEGPLATPFRPKRKLKNVDSSQAVAYDISLFQGKKETMYLILDNAVSPAERTDNGELPRGKVAGFGSEDGKSGKAGSSKKLLKSLEIHAADFPMVTQQRIVIGSDKSVIVRSEAVFEFEGDQFIEGKQGRRKTKYVAGTRIRFTPKLLDGKLCSVVAANHLTCSSVLPGHFRYGLMQPDKWEVPYLATDGGDWVSPAILEGVTTGAGESFVVWFHGVSQDESGKSAAEDLAVIALVKPTIVPAQEDKRQALADPLIERADAIPSEVVLEADTQQPVKRASLAEDAPEDTTTNSSKAALERVAYKIQCYELESQALDRLLNQSFPNQKAPMSLMQLGQSDSKLHRNFSGLMNESIASSQARLVGQPTLVARLNRAVEFLSGGEIPCETGVVEFAKLVPQGVEFVPFGIQLKLTPMAHPTSGKLLTLMEASHSALKSVDGESVTHHTVRDGENRYINRPEMNYTGLQTALTLDFGNTSMISMRFATRHPHDNKVAEKAILFLITPSPLPDVIVDPIPSNNFRVP